jgi:predicted metal-binding membrane protein
MVLLFVFGVTNLLWVACISGFVLLDTWVLFSDQYLDLVHALNSSV